MRGTDFDYRHQRLLHVLVVAAAFLTYALQPDDIVWALVKNHSTDRTLLERLVFGSGALMVLGSALFQTWATAYSGSGTKAGPPMLARDGPYRYVQQHSGAS
jgi:hypothetical protein